MKLWKKISLLTAVVLFIAMGIFGGGMLYETWKYNLNQTVSSYQQQMKVNSYVIAQEINNNPLSRFSEVTRKSFLNYTVQKYGGTDYIPVSYTHLAFPGYSGRHIWQKGPRQNPFWPMRLKS